MPIDDLTPENTIEDKETGIAVDIVTEDGFNKMVVKTSSTPDSGEDADFLQLKNGAAFDMTVDGSVTPVDFTVGAHATKDIFVKELKFNAFDSGVKIDKFLGSNSALTNGVLVEYKSFDTITTFLAIKSTAEFNGHFAFGSGKDFLIVQAAGNDFVTATYGPLQPFVLKKQGTYATDDYVKVTIRDDLSSRSFLDCVAFIVRD